MYEDMYVFVYCNTYVHKTSVLYSTVTVCCMVSFFVHQKKDQLSHYAPQLSDRTFNKVLGFISVSSFICGTDLALSGTSEGTGIIWEVDRHAKVTENRDTGVHVRLCTGCECE